MPHVMVQYRVHPDRVAENEELVRAVYDELATSQPEGLHYATFKLPDDFRFGVATAGFQIEGGYNGEGEPANNWADWERSGRVEPSGIALDFWNRAEDHLDLAAAAGCDAFRLSIEWARCEPAEGEVDDDAFDRYAAIRRSSRSRARRSTGSSS